MAHLEDQDLIEERSTRLMVALEGRAEALLEALREARVQREAMSSRLDELERQRQSLETRNAELTAEAREGDAERESLEQRVSELQRRLADVEASCLELLEENRELDEQNRELEAHNRHLREDREVTGERDTASFFQRRGRPAQGLSALIGHRHRDDEPPKDDAVPDEAPASEPAPTSSPESTEVSSSRQDALPSIEEAPSPQALLEQWYQRYPDAFFKGHTRPLQVGIHEALAERESWPEKLVRRALACYVNLPRYLKSVREGAERIDLTGAAAGEVDAGAAEHARKKLDRLQSDRRKSAKSTRRMPRSNGKGRHAAGDVRHDKPVRDVPAPSVEADGNDDEPEDSRLQRKLGELVARHNPR